MKMMGIASATSLQVLPWKGGVQNMGSICVVCLPLEQGEVAQHWFNQKLEARNLVEPSLPGLCSHCYLTPPRLLPYSITSTQPFAITHLPQGAFAMADSTPTTVVCSPENIQVPCGPIACHHPSPGQGGSPGRCWSPPQLHLRTCLSSLTAQGAQCWLPALMLQMSWGI